MKTSITYLLSVFIIFAIISHVHTFYGFSDSDDSDAYGILNNYEDDPADKAMKQMNENLDELSNVVQKEYLIRVKDEIARTNAEIPDPKNHITDLTDLRKERIFKQCFKEKFDYGMLQTGNKNTIFDIGDKSLFDLSDNDTDEKEDDLKTEKNQIK